MVSYSTWAIFLAEEKGTCLQVLPPPSRPQHLAESLHEHLVKGGLIGWYLEYLGTVPILNRNRQMESGIGRPEIYR